MRINIRVRVAALWLGATFCSTVQAVSTQEKVLEHLARVGQDISHRQVMLETLQQAAATKNSSVWATEQDIRDATFQLESEINQLQAQKDQVTARFRQAKSDPFKSAILRQDPALEGANSPAANIQIEFDSLIEISSAALTPEPRPSSISDTIRAALGTMKEKLNRSEKNGVLSSLFGNKRKQEQAKVARAMQLSAIDNALIRLDGEPTDQQQAQQNNALLDSLSEIVEDVPPEQDIEIYASIADLLLPEDADTENSFDADSDSSPYYSLELIAADQITADYEGNYGQLPVSRDELIQLVMDEGILLSDDQVNTLVATSQQTSDSPYGAIPDRFIQDNDISEGRNQYGSIPQGVNQYGSIPRGPFGDLVALIDDADDQAATADTTSNNQIITLSADQRSLLQDQQTQDAQPVQAQQRRRNALPDSDTQYQTIPLDPDQLGQLAAESDGDVLPNDDADAEQDDANKTGFGFGNNRGNNNNDNNTNRRRKAK